MPRKRTPFRRITKKSYAFKKRKRPFVSWRRRASIRNRLLQVSLNRLRRSQLRTLRPVYCRVFRRKSAAPAIYTSWFLVVRVVRSITAFRKLYLTPASLRDLVSPSSLSPLAFGGSTRGRLHTRFAQVGYSARGYRRELSAHQGRCQQRLTRHSKYRVYRAYRHVRRISTLFLRKRLVDGRARLAINFMARISRGDLLRRRATSLRRSTRPHRVQRLRIRVGRFKKRRRGRRRVRVFNKSELTLPRRAVRPRVIYRRRQRAFYRRLRRRRAFPRVSGAISSQRRRRRQRRRSRAHFSTKRTYSVRAFSAFRYRLRRSNPKGLKGPHWRRRRRGRRLFAGIFGKRRFRIERRDKILFKRTTLRFFAKRTLLTRTLQGRSVFTAKHYRRQLALRSGARAVCEVVATAVQPTIGASMRIALRQAAFRTQPYRSGARVTGLQGLGFFPHLRQKSLPIHKHAGLSPLRKAVFVLPNTYQRTLLRHSAAANIVACRIAKTFSSRYRTWQQRSVLFKLATQRHLRDGRLSGTAPLALSGGTSSASQALNSSLLSLSASAYGVKSGRRPGLQTSCASIKTHRNLSVTRTEFTSTLPTSELLTPHVAASCDRTGSAILRGKVATAADNFLAQAFPLVYRIGSTCRRSSSLQLSLGARLQRLNRSLRGRYHQSKLRLPGTTMSRRRCRRGGRGLFLHNVLKKPQTALGRKDLFLAPLGAYTGSVPGYEPQQRTLSSALLSPRHRDDNKPRFWFRPPTRANLRSVYKVRLRRLYQLRRRALVLKKFHSQFRRLVRGRRASNYLVQPPQCNLGLSSDIATQSALSGATSHKAAAHADVTASLLLNTPNTVARTVLTGTRLPAKVRRVGGLWHYRSVHSMLRKERALCAWTPRLAARKRRWSYPRVNGVSLPRRRISFKAERERIRQNANLLLRNLPQRKYIDYGAVKLQYHLGSTGATGFKRLRRVHRAHSVYSRWWYPTKHTVPFAHPFSRRSLNAKLYRRYRFSRANTGLRSDLAGAMARLRIKTAEQKFPGRAIPWRNFRFRRPRRGVAPSTLQRWTAKRFEGRTPTAGLRDVPSVLMRTSRELRGLEKFFSSNRVWSHRAWLTLDSDLSSITVNSAFSSALNCIPRAAWFALRRGAASAESYASTQRHLLSQFRYWANKQRPLARSSSEFLFRAQDFVLRTVAVLLAGVRTVSVNTQQVYQHHAALRLAGFTRKALIKRSRFLSLRELPRVELLAKTVNNPTALQHSVLKKHWLRGAERLLRRSQLGYTPPSRSRYVSPASISFGRRRVRFPASGRRKGSYDSLLHSFVKRTAPARFRRVSPLRFTPAAIHGRGDFRWNLLVGASTRGDVRRRMLAQKVSCAAYLSSSWRKLLAYRAGNLRKQFAPFIREKTKSRFAALPANVIFCAVHAQISTKSPLRRHPMHAIRAGILRRALRRRRDERIFSDLCKSVLSRRTPRDQAPSAGKLRRAAKRKLSGRSGPWSLLSRTPHSIRWTLSHLSTAGPRVEFLAKQPITSLPSGESFVVPYTATRRNRRAFRGFTVAVSVSRAHRLRRKKRDSRKRHRGYRRRRARSFRAVMCRIRHWSERKSTRRLLRFSLQKRRVYALRFGRALQATISASTTADQVISVYHKIPRLQRFLSQPQLAQHNRTPTKFLFGDDVSYKTYVARTSLPRRSRRKRLYRRSRLLRLKHRSRGRRVLEVQRTLKLKKTVAAALQRVRLNTAHKLVASSRRTSVVAALLFQRPAAASVQSVGAKNKAILAAITSKETRYKLTAQYAESLLEFIPAFISQMLSKKIKVGAETITYRTAQYLIRNIYWSLRVYLNVDPFDSRFELREQKPVARVQLSEAISLLSTVQKTEQPQRALLRYRFQVGRIPLAASTLRFRGDWLRAFFPAKHALYQEDPEDYGLFLFRTRDIRRLRIGGRGIASWRTAYPGVSQETRARQVLTLRYSRATPRFETLLQTLRRAPQAELGPVVGLLLSRESFFVRHQSTYPSRSIALTAGWLHRKRRFVSFDSKWRTVNPTVAAAARRSVLAHIEPRGRTNYVSDSRPAISASFIDARRARAKSPRSRQYVLRVSVPSIKLSKATRFTRLQYLRRLRRAFVPTASRNRVWLRHYRRSVFELIAPQQRSVQQILKHSRRVYGTRRLRTLPTQKSRALVRVVARQGFSLLRRKLRRLFKQRRSCSTVVRRDYAALPGVLGRSSTRSKPCSVLYKRPRVIFRASIHPTECIRRKRRRGRRRIRRGVKRYALPPIRRRRSILLSKSLGAGSAVARSAGLLRWRGANPVAVFSTAVGPKLLRSNSGLQLVRRNNFSVACAKRVRQRRQTPFDSYRPHLWKKLTLRWMKKFRVGRYWVRDTSRWLRDPWLSQIVACDMSLRPDRTGGELRSRDQQVGEYVPDVDALGRDIPESRAAFRERNPLTPRAQPKARATKRIIARVAAPLASHRLQISKVARRKPIPAMWLANYEYRDAIREHKEEKAKSRKQKDSEEFERIKAYWARKVAKLPEERPRRAPLKHPANLWLPKIIWSEIQRRVRKFEWRESDEVFFRPGFRNAFRFYPPERNRAPWLEHLMYTRATYSTCLHEFRRWQFPREQKKYKWLQRVRKGLYSNRLTHYIKRRRWPQLRQYNQKLHYTLFSMPDREAARRHFKKLNRRSRPNVSGFVSASAGLANRLDVTLMKLGVAPSIYWARIVAQFCLLRINGISVSNPAYLLQPGDLLQPEWDSIARFQHYFKPQLRRREAHQRRNRTSTGFYPNSIEYHRGTRALIYKHAPDESDLRRSSRLQPRYFRWFKLDSV